MLRRKTAENAGTTTEVRTFSVSGYEAVLLHVEPQGFYRLLILDGGDELCSFESDEVMMEPFARQLIIAYEAGKKDGKIEGEAGAQAAMRRALGL